MIRTLTLVTALLFSISALTGQIVVDDRTLPEAGDSVELLVDNLPMGISVGNPGSDQFWDFSGLQAPFQQTFVYQNADEGEGFSSFPSADLFLGEQGTVESYYRIRDGQLQELGFFGSDPLGFGLSAAGRYTSPYVIKNTPMMYGDDFNQTTSLLFPVSGESLPDTLLDLLPVVPDSIRLRIELERDDDVDAWGIAALGNEDFNVLRQRRKEYRSVRVDAIVPGFPFWTDISLIIENIIPGLIMSDTIYQYNFYDEVHVQPIVSLTVDENDQVLRADYIPTDMMTPVQTFIDNGTSKLFVYPNPTLGPVRFDFINFQPGRYTIKIMSILGVTVWEEQVILNGEKTLMADIGFLRRGTYLYSLSNEQNKRLFTKRLLVMKP